MNSSPLRKEAILPRLNGIQNNILHLREFSALSLEEFTKEEILDRVEHHLRLALEGVFHITAHILSRIPGARAAVKKLIQDPGKFGLTIE